MCLELALKTQSKQMCLELALKRMHAVRFTRWKKMKRGDWRQWMEVKDRGGVDVIISHGGRGRLKRHTLNKRTKSFRETTVL